MLIILDTDTLHAHSAGLESRSKQCHTLLNSIASYFGDVVLKL